MYTKILGTLMSFSLSAAIVPAHAQTDPSLPTQILCEAPLAGSTSVLSVSLRPGLGALEVSVNGGLFGSVGADRYQPIRDGRSYQLAFFPGERPVGAQIVDLVKDGETWRTHVNLSGDFPGESSVHAVDQWLDCEAKDTGDTL